MKRPVWKYVALAGALLGALVVGAVAGGGTVYAMVRRTSPIRLIRVSRGDAAAVPMVLAKEADPVSDPEDGIVIASVAPGLVVEEVQFGPGNAEAVQSFEECLPRFWCIQLVSMPPEPQLNTMLLRIFHNLLNLFVTPPAPEPLNHMIFKTQLSGKS